MYIAYLKQHELRQSVLWVAGPLKGGHGILQKDYIVGSEESPYKGCVSFWITSSYDHMTPQTQVDPVVPQF